jgi:hypothetical protein
MGKHKAGAAKTAASAAASETSSSANELRTNTAAEKTEDRPGQWVVFGAVLGTTHIIFVYLLMFANCNVLSLLSILLLSPVLPAVHHRYGCFSTQIVRAIFYKSTRTARIYSHNIMQEVWQSF